MRKQDRVALILAGGTGLRFWPLSTRERPKQFLTLLGGESLLRSAYRRACLLTTTDRVLVVTADDLAEDVHAHLPEVAESNLLVEPVQRDTAAAVCLGTLVAQARWSDAAMVVLPADHWVGSEEGFDRAMGVAFDIAEGSDALVTLGIRPDRPATEYGYIETLRWHKTGGLRWAQVAAFHEKPDDATARRYLSSGRHWWNSGMFVWSVARVMKELRTHLPLHVRALCRALDALPGGAGGRVTADGLVEAYAGLPRISIDHGMMEKVTTTVMIEAPFDWSDLGGWDALEGFLPADGAGNRAIGSLHAFDSRSNLVFCEDPGETIGLVGVSDLIVVRAGHRTLVTSKGRGQDLKRLVEKLRLQDEGRSRG